MPTGNFQRALCAGLLVVVSMTTAAAQKAVRANNSASISTDILLRILRYEDERRWDDDLRLLLATKDAKVRKRAALAMGRIGDERAVPVLIDLLKQDADQDVRQMAAFAIGEIESPAGADALIAVLDDTREPAAVRARAVEALGKIGAVLLSNSTTSSVQSGLPKAEDKQLAKIRLAILDVLKFEAGRRSTPDRLTVLLGLTAALRARPEGAGSVIIRFLDYSDPRIVADALNTMARLRLKDGSDQVRRLLGNGDAIVRANAARVIGAAEDKGAYDKLLGLALHDIDLRVRVSAIRALGSLKDARAAESLISRGNSLLATTSRIPVSKPLVSSEKNELLEIVTSLGRVIPNSNNDAAVQFLRLMRKATNLTAPEVEIAFVKIAPETYLGEQPWPRLLQEPPMIDSLTEMWQQQASLAQGLREIAGTKLASSEATERLHARAEEFARVMGCFEVPSSTGQCNTKTFAVPDTLRAYAAFKPADLARVLQGHFNLLSTTSKMKPKGIYSVASNTVKGNYDVPEDVITRATAADLLSELPPDAETTRLLVAAFPISTHDELNDAALSILDALATGKSAAAKEVIKSALDSPDYLIRRRAVALLKANGAGDFSNRIGTVRTRNTEADYRRALARIGRTVTATLETSKGAFTIEFLPEEAPLTVDNFVQLARKGYFNGQAVPRVVPNFVIQTGDPRGDQNGGPGYQIRCEINETPYERGAVGMALSGKDTGGSQWFATHSPQPHLDGGYTVFGRVIRGMEVVDSIARGDTIRRVIVNER